MWEVNTFWDINVKEKPEIDNIPQPDGRLYGWDKLVKTLTNKSNTHTEVLWVGVRGDGGQVAGILDLSSCCRL